MNIIMVGHTHLIMALAASHEFVCDLVIIDRTEEVIPMPENVIRIENLLPDIDYEYDHERDFDVKKPIHAIPTSHNMWKNPISNSIQKQRKFITNRRK